MLGQKLNNTKKVERTADKVTFYLSNKNVKKEGVLIFMIIVCR